MKPSDDISGLCGYRYTSKKILPSIEENVQVYFVPEDGDIGTIRNIFLQPIPGVQVFIQRLANTMVKAAKEARGGVA